MIIVDEEEEDITDTPASASKLAEKTVLETPSSIAKAYQAIRDDILSKDYLLFRLS